MEPTTPETEPKNNAQDTAASADAKDTAAAQSEAVEIAEGALLTLAKESKYDDARALLALGANVNTLNEQRESALTLALGNYDVRMTRLFLRAGADVSKYEDQTGKSLLSVLRHAGSTFKPEEETIACMLLDHGAAANVRDNLGLPLIARYASLGMLQAVERILEAGADPNAINPDSKLSALYFAINGDAKSLPVIAALLEGGANPNGSSEEKTLPLFLAVRQKNLPAAEMLLQAGADASRTSPDTSMTPLLQALKNGQADMIDLLVAHGADIHATLPDGARALDVLVRDNASIEAVQKALALGARADVCRLDDHGAPVESALHLAVRHKRTEMINEMLKAGADPLVVDGFGYTPLQLAHSMLGGDDAIVDRLRLADGAARVERERTYRAAAVDAPPPNSPPRPPAP